IKATSDAQTLWANKAEVTFSSVNKTIDIDNSMFGGSRADTMSASGDVQVLLSDGGRAFCDKLDGDISQDMASLTGNVVIAYERMLMNKGETASLTLNRNDGKGRWSGAGQALFLESPIDVTGDHRINRPTTSSTTEQEKLSEISMRANWTESMNLDQKFNEGAGAIDISGQVSVRSQRTPQERSQMTGDDLRLEFSDNSSPDAKEVKELHKVIAKQNAQIEHRTWDLLFPDLPPVVYYIGGDHLEFNSFTQEALAVGLGELVIRDPRKADNQVHQSALAGRGTTRFTWDNKLQTTRLKDNTYRLEMTGNVEMVHKGLDGRIGMLTTDKLNAIAIDPTAEDLVVSGSELTLRGMDLQQINANGRVYVATETRRVDCDLFNYNLKTGFAQLEAVNANTIAVVTEGSPYPVRAKSIVWNMDPTVDTISIKGLQGTGTK
ncbi:MAG TPA: hypothetical protein DD622_06735, partial [Opitutae bacterium]|nr:hypothetical protein [Opitutae bacterium]